MVRYFELFRTGEKYPRRPIGPTLNVVSSNLMLRTAVKPGVAPFCQYGHSPQVATSASHPSAPIASDTVVFDGNATAVPGSASSRPVPSMVYAAEPRIVYWICSACTCRCGTLSPPSADRCVIDRYRVLPALGATSTCRRGCSVAPAAMGVSPVLSSMAPSSLRDGVEKDVLVDARNQTFDIRASCQNVGVLDHVEVRQV